MKNIRTISPVFPGLILLVLLLLTTGNFLVSATLRIPPFKYLHRNWNTRHGLPQNSVYCMQQDPRGNLWIGTGKGVVRFDGLEFKHFKDTGRPAVNNYRITSMLRSSEDDIWMGTYGGGAVRYHDGRFFYYSHLTGLPHDFILCIAEGAKNEMWMGTLGGGLVKFENNRPTTFTTASGLAHNTVNTLIRDTTGKLWIGTSGGLHRLDKYTGAGSQNLNPESLRSSFTPTTSITFTPFNTRHGLPGNHITSLYEDRRNYLWVGTTRGIARSTRKINRPGAERAKTPLPPLRFKTIAGIPGTRIHAVRMDWDYKIWITAGKQIYNVTYPENSPSATPRVETFSRPELFFSHPVISLYVDDEGTTWFGTQDKGFGNLYKFTNTFCTVVDEYTGKDVTAIYQEASGKIWVGTRRGRLFLYDNGNSRSFSRANGFSASAVTSLAGDRAGTTWIGTAEGLWSYRQGRFNKIRGGPTGINTIYIDREGTPWIGTNGNGLYKYMSSSRGKKRRFRGYGKIEGLSNLDVLSITSDGRGKIWVGTRGGLFSLWRNEFRHYTRKNNLSSDIITDLYSDLDGSLWIATHGGGLVRFNQNQFKPVNAPEHFAGTVIYRILEDKMKRLWFSTNNGIFCLSKYHLDKYAGNLLNTLDCYHLHETRLPTSVFNGGYQPAGCRTETGNLWFPTAEGITVIVPSKDLFRLPPSQVNFVHTVVDDQYVDLEERKKLPAGTNKITFTVSAPDFISPEKVRYKFQWRFAKHRLSAKIDDGWEETRSISGNAFTIPNLESGFYTVAVIASSSEGEWNYKSRSTAIITFSVNETFFETIWFYVLMVLPAIGLFFGYQQLAKKRSKERPGLFSQTGKYKTFTLHKKDSKKYLKGLLDFMEQEKPYLDSEMSMPKLAKLLDMSKEELSQVINKELFLNFNAFMNKYRINEAKRKLRDPKENQFVILKIAHDVGFNSKSTFNSVFKQMTGMSPTQYRKKYQKPDEKEGSKK